MENVQHNEPQNESPSAQVKRDRAGWLLWTFQMVAALFTIMNLTPSVMTLVSVIISRF